MGDLLALFAGMLTEYAVGKKMGKMKAFLAVFSLVFIFTTFYCLYLGKEILFTLIGGFSFASVIGVFLVLILFFVEKRSKAATFERDAPSSNHGPSEQ